MVHPSSVSVGVRQQREETRALDGIAELALIAGTGAGKTSGDDLARLGDEVFQHIDVFVVDPLDFLAVKRQNLRRLKSAL